LIRRIVSYFRHAATTPLDPRVRERMALCLEEDPGAEGSLLSEPRRGGKILDEARERLALFMGASPSEIVFTSGGTEASNLALKGAALAPPREPARRRILVAATEPAAILHPARTLGRLGWEFSEIPVDGRGVVDTARLRSMLDDRVLLVSMSLANAETGVLQDLPGIARLTRDCGALLHTDAGVAAMHLPLRVDDLGVDLLSLSAHRMYGPRGAGALYVRDGVRLAPLVEGGIEEGGLRAGAQSVAAIAGFGEAAALATVERQAWKERSWEVGRALASGILESIPEVVHHGAAAERVEAMVCLSVAGVEGESLLLGLERAGFAASSGSPCADEAGKPSHVLLAMGVSPRLAQSSILLAAGRGNSVEEAERLVAHLCGDVSRLREMSVVERA